MPEEVLDCVSFTVPPDALEHFEAACSSVCRAVSFFHDEANDLWQISAVKERGAYEAELAGALSLAEMLTGISPVVERSVVPIAGWLARTESAFPEQLIGRRFAIRGTHIVAPRIAGRITITVDAGLAFGTGEHNSTRGCLVALESLHRRPARILDIGTGSGILAIAAGRMFPGAEILASDIDPRAARVARANARLNQVRLAAIRADGYDDPQLRGRQFDLIFANILARPLCAMAHQLAAHLAPGGTAILAGLLTTQAPWVLSAHRRAGLALDAHFRDGAWSILTVRRKSYGG